jgi:hypothetical protein
MADKIIERIHFTDTNEIKDIEREMTADELAQWEADKAEAQARQAAEATKAAAKQALLDKLGITAEEAQLLLGGN